jgi:hypothetical protein
MKTAIQQSVTLDDARDVHGIHDQRSEKFTKSRDGRLTFTFQICIIIKYFE